MTKLEKLERKVNLIVKALHHFLTIMNAKNPGLDFTKIDPLYATLAEEIKNQCIQLRKEASKPTKPLKPKALLEQIQKEGKISKELLEEIDKTLAIKS